MDRAVEGPTAQVWQSESRDLVRVEKIAAVHREVVETTVAILVGGQIVGVTVALPELAGQGVTAAQAGDAPGREAIGTLQHGAEVTFGQIKYAASTTNKLRRFLLNPLVFPVLLSIPPSKKFI